MQCCEHAIMKTSLQITTFIRKTQQQYQLVSVYAIIFEAAGGRSSRARAHPPLTISVYGGVPTSPVRFIQFAMTRTGGGASLADD